MPQYPMPGQEQRSQEKYLIFGDQFEKMDNSVSRFGANPNRLYWAENFQWAGENTLEVPPAPAAAAAFLTSETIVLAFYAALNNGQSDYVILFTAAGAGFSVNLTNNTSGQFAPDGTFSTAPDCTSWQQSRVLINDSKAGYCTFDGKTFVQAGGMSPNIQVTAGGANYATPPLVTVVVNTGMLSGITFTGGTGLTAPPNGTYSLTIGPPPLGGLQAAANVTVAGGVVQSPIVITNPGGGYAAAPAVTFPAQAGGTPAVFTASITPAGGGTKGAAATAQITNGQVTSVTLTNPGVGFNPTDSVTLTFSQQGGQGANIPVTMTTASVVQVTCIDTGLWAQSGSPLAPGPYPLLVSGGGGSGAACSASIAYNPFGFGAITGQPIVVSAGGSGYSSAPSVSWDNVNHPLNIAVSGGHLPLFTVTQMTNYAVASLGGSFPQGTGYPPSATLPLVFSGGNPITPATGTATTNASGQITSVALTNGGNYPFGGVPTVTVAAGSGAQAIGHPWPTVPKGSTIAVFQGRVWLAGGNLLQWTGTGASFAGVGYDDFLPIDASGSLQIVDADLVHQITALRSLNNYLFILGDQSVKQIGNLSILPGNVTGFAILTLSSDQGTIWPKSCISFNRIFMFANANGIFGVFGSTVQKISEDLDKVFRTISFTQQVHAGVADINAKHTAVFLLQKWGDQFGRGAISIELMFDGKRWWIANQGATLAAIVTVPNLATNQNTLYGSLLGTDLTQLFSNTGTTLPVRIETARSHAGNVVQAKRVLRAGVNWSGTKVNVSPSFAMSIESELGVVARTLPMSPGLATLVGGANDANNNPITGSGFYLGLSCTANLSVGTLFRFAAIEYQETSLWRGFVNVGQFAPFLIDERTGKVLIDESTGKGLTPG